MQRRMKHTKGLQLVLVGIGFASFLGMNSFSLWGLSYLPQFAFGDDMYSYWSAPISLCNILAFFVSYFGCRRFPRLFNRAPFFEAVILMSAGMIFLLGFFLSQFLVLLIISGILAGIGSTCCFICWELTFALSEQKEAQKQIVLGSLLGTFPFVLFIISDQSLLLFEMLLLVLCNLVFLFFSLTFNKTDTIDGAAPVEQQFLPHITKRYWKQLLCIAMIGIISPVLGSVSFRGELGFIENSILVLCANILSAVFLGVVWFLLKKRTTIPGTYFIVFPVLITAFLLFPFLEESSRVFILFIGSFGFTLFSIVMMMSCISIARKEKTSLVFVYSLFAGFIYGSRMVGQGLATALENSPLSQETQIITSVLILLYGCSLVMFLFARKGAEKEVFDDQIKEVDPLKEACDAIAEENKFSERQAQVLNLLVHGYDVPSIAKKLFISENTVRSHTKKIYLLLDIHSKQEIIELANKSTDPPPDHP